MRRRCFVKLLCPDPMLRTSAMSSTSADSDPVLRGSAERVATYVQLSDTLETPSCHGPASRFPEETGLQSWNSIHGFAFCLKPFVVCHSAARHQNVQTVYLASNQLGFYEHPFSLSPRETRNVIPLSWCSANDLNKSIVGGGLGNMTV